MVQPLIKLPVEEVKGYNTFREIIILVLSACTSVVALHLQRKELLTELMNMESVFAWSESSDLSLDLDFLAFNLLEHAPSLDARVAVRVEDAHSIVCSLLSLYHLTIISLFSNYI